MERFGRVWREEMSGISLRGGLARLLAAGLPAGHLQRSRAALLRLAGVQIGRGTLFAGWPTFTGAGRHHSLLVIGPHCFFNVETLFDLGAPVDIGERVHVGQRVSFITTSHEIGPPIQRAAQLTARPIQVGRGCWLGAGCTVLPGVSIGEGSIVAAGAVVTRDIPPHVLATGTPARPVRDLPLSSTAVPDDVPV